MFDLPPNSRILWTCPFSNSTLVLLPNGAAVWTHPTNEGTHSITSPRGLRPLLCLLAARVIGTVSAFATTIIRRR